MGFSFSPGELLTLCDQLKAELVQVMEQYLYSLLTHMLGAVDSGQGCTVRCTLLLCTSLYCSVVHSSASFAEYVVQVTVLVVQACQMLAALVVETGKGGYVSE